LRDPDVRYVYDALGYNGLTPNVPGASSKLPCDDDDMAISRASTKIVSGDGKLPLSDTTTGVIAAHHTVTKEMPDDN
jgi:hypothetical protein